MNKQPSNFSLAQRNSCDTCNNTITHKENQLSYLLCTGFGNNAAHPIIPKLYLNCAGPYKNQTVTTPNPLAISMRVFVDDACPQHKPKPPSTTNKSILCASF